MIKVKIRALETQARSKDDELALLAKRDLAAIHYAIRDYAFGAVAYRDFLPAAEAAETVYPADYYSAVCCMCLSGDKRSALLYMAKCLALNKSSKIDPSVRLKRELFDIDPEIKLIRRDPVYLKLIEEAFGKRKAPETKSRSKSPR